MKNITTYITLTLILCFSLAEAQDNYRFKFGMNIKGFFPGIEVAVEHPLSPKIQLESVWGINEIRYKNMKYSNAELIFRFHHFKTEEKKNLNYSPYVKIKKSRYNKYADTASVHDASIHTNVMLYAGAGGFVAYRLLLGKNKHFMVEPFAGIGINAVLVSDDLNILQIDFDKLHRDIEPDLHLGLGIAWVF